MINFTLWHITIQLRIFTPVVGYDCFSSATTVLTVAWLAFLTRFWVQFNNNIQWFNNIYSFTDKYFLKFIGFEAIPFFKFLIELSITQRVFAESTIASTSTLGSNGSGLDEGGEFKVQMFIRRTELPPTAKLSAEHSLTVLAGKPRLLQMCCYSQCFSSICQYFLVIIYKLLKCCWLSVSNFLYPICYFRFILKSWKIVKHNHYKN